MVMWDLCIDPASSTISGAWIWRDGGGYFGVPLVNFLGWYLCVFTIYLVFALYLRRTAEWTRAAHLGERATWALPAVMYAAVMLPRLIEPHGEVTRIVDGEAPLALRKRASWIASSSA